MSSTEKEVQEPEIKVQTVKSLEDKPKDQDLDPCGWFRFPSCSESESDSDSEGENRMRSEKRCKKKTRKQKPKNCKN